MSDATIIPANPLLSPDFDKARRLSRILAFVFTVGFWLGIVLLVCLTIYAVWLVFDPNAAELFGFVKRIPPGGAAAGAMALVVVGMGPPLASLFYARRVFSGFANGEVFTTATIASMRATALWLVVAGIVPPRPLVLVIGIAAYVTAYVVAEARRIADDNASIV